MRTDARFAAVVLALVLGLSHEVGAQLPPAFHPAVTVLNSDDGPNDSFHDRVLRILWYTALEMKISPEDLPPITVIRTNRDTTNQMGLDAGPNGAMLVYGSPGTRKCLYELWIVADDPSVALATGFIQVLTVQFHLEQARSSSDLREIAQPISRTHATGTRF